MSSVEEFLNDPAFQTPKPITVQLPGSTRTIDCKCPDLMYMVMSGVMTWPALQRVRELNASAPDDGTVLDNRPMPTMVDRATAAGTMLDEWVCLAAIAPRVVMHEHEAGPNALWIERLPFPARQAIFNATFRVPTTAGADFRSEQSGSAPPRQSGETVRDETLVAVGNDGTDGGAGS